MYLLEDGTFLHVEYQTTVKKHDTFRFGGYVLGLYNKFKDDKRYSAFIFKSVIIYAPHIKRASVKSSLDLGSILYQFDPLFLNEVQQEESYLQIIDKIRQNPNVQLTDDEKMIILYKPLFNRRKKKLKEMPFLLPEIFKNYRMNPKRCT
ncbi:hypothetical protein [Robertmurraya kyonggiensis]|uniref:Uncharacterized protein n=1 Tax=Robertmurraya kyonggiensis TaxID=1037680 RepID=A0A4U1CWZ5_9BACI|nr:hypothetical protein [Robertmurraya kyonggiensis]TKC13835.1 hypothetical protein FA727_22865 [Robertmurraya kyonggiensis]